MTNETGLPTPNVTCFDKSTLQFNNFAFVPSMGYEMLARVRSTGGTVACSQSGTNASVTVSGARDVWVTWVGDTEYSMDAGDAAHNFSFRGPNPHPSLVSLINTATSQSYEATYNQHVEDYTGLMDVFSLDLGQEPDLKTPTDQLMSSYAVDVGNKYVEWLEFNFGRYLLAGSARGTLPANLQGKWAPDSSSPWSAGTSVLAVLVRCLQCHSHLFML